MSDFWLLTLFFLFDFGFSLAGLNFYTLLLFPPYLFIRDYSSGVVLYLGGGAVILSELIHQHTLGSLALGAGLALLLVDWVLDAVYWHRLLTQISCLFLYFIVIVLSQAMVYRLTFGGWSYPPLSSFLITYGLGCLMLIYRFFTAGDSYSGQTGIDAS